MNIGDDFRDHTAALLRTRYDNVQTEVQLTAKKADIFFQYRFGPRRTITAAAECKKWNRTLTRDDVRKIIDDYKPALEKKEITELWIICDRAPAAGARDYVEAFEFSQIMTALEFEQSIVDFQPLLTFLASDFQNDKIAKYFIHPSFYVDEEKKNDLHSHVRLWLGDDASIPIAIWGGYGMGKTSYARYLASELAQNCQKDYGSRIPIVLNLGDFTTAPNLETLIFSQLTNFYGVRHFSAAAFRILNAQHRFILILDGFDEMKFAMAPNEFAYISAEMRKVAAINPKLILLGRPDSIETDEEEKRLTSSKLYLHSHTIRADDAPDFSNIRLAFFSKDEYLSLIRKFLANEQGGSNQSPAIDETLRNIESLKLDDILERPVQAKMLAEIVTDPHAQISNISRFTLYELFIKKILRREEEKTARKFLGSDARIKFMRYLAWWLWTEKKTRTFTALEIPLEIIQKFQISGIPLEGLRRELLIGSLVEERNIGHFLAEKTAGVFYFPHTSFTEFLVADYIMSSDFLNIDVRKLPNSLYGEVPTFLKEHPSKDALPSVYKRIKQARIALSTSSISVFLNDFDIRVYIETAKPSQADPWDICLRYFLHKALNTDLQARQFIFDCLNSPHQPTELAAMFCVFYEESGAGLSFGSAIARMILHIFRRIGFNDLISAAKRGATTARSKALNHLAEIVTNCIRISPREGFVIVDFTEFTSVALSFIGTSCAVNDVIENMRKLYSVPINDLLASLEDRQERSALAEILHTGGKLQVIASL
jgi:hypothetical protein